jgi:hypothetical protein
MFAGFFVFHTALSLDVSDSDRVASKMRKPRSASKMRKPRRALKMRSAHTGRMQKVCPPSGQTFCKRVSMADQPKARQTSEANGVYDAAPSRNMDANADGVIGRAAAANPFSV